MLHKSWGDAVESSSRFATYVAFGLFCFAIFIPIIRHAFFKVAILYFAVAFETIDIFFNDFLIVHGYATHFLLTDVTVEQPNGVLNAIEEAVSTLREVSRVLSRRRAAMGEILKQDRQIRLVYSRGGTT